jgi:hypothetical protein
MRNAIRRSGRCATQLSIGWIPIAALLTYFVVLVPHVSRLVSTSLWNGDVVSINLLLPELGHPGQGNLVYLPSDPFYSVFALHALLIHSHWLYQWWPMIGLVLGIGTAALMVWMTAMALGKRAALLCGVVVLCASPAMLGVIVPANFHVSTWFNDAVLGLLLVTLAGGPGHWTGRYVALSVAVAALTGLDLASDPLLAVAGLAPFVMTPLMLAVVSRDPAAAWLAKVAVGVAVATVVVSLGVSYLMSGLGVSRRGFALSDINTPSRILTSTVTAGLGLLELLNGALGHAWIAIHALEAAAIGAFVSILVAGAFILVARHAMGRGNGRGAADSARIHTLFWTLSGFLVLVAFLSTSYTRGVTSTRYLVPEFYALAALLPALLLTTGRRWAAGALAATAIALGSAAAMPAYLGSVEPQNSTAVLVQFLAKHDLTHGYAGYPDASPVTWQSGGRIESRPILQGGNCRTVGELCPDTLWSAQRWYRPIASSSFVVVDPTGQYVRHRPGQKYGKPSAIYQVGRWTVYVYPYDVATRFGPPSTI